MIYEGRSKFERTPFPSFAPLGRQQQQVRWPPVLLPEGGKRERRSLVHSAFFETDMEAGQFSRGTVSEFEWRGPGARIDGRGGD